MNQRVVGEPEHPIDLHVHGERLMALARPGGTSALILDPSTPTVDRMLVALTSGSALDPRRWAQPSGVLVLRGLLQFSDHGTVVTRGDWTCLPTDGRTIVATEDTYLLLFLGPGA